MTGNAAAAIEERSAMVDETVAHAYRTHLAAAFPQGMAALAVGGFGRRELFPHSDVDLLLLVEKEVHGDSQREALSAFLRVLWDSGLRLSQSVRTVAECCQLHQQNTELSISLLDQRFLVGDSHLYETLVERLPKFFRNERETLVKHLCQLAAARHAKFHDTIYHLEPNLKETPGGMRDLHLVHWLLQLTGAEETVQELQPARDFLAVLRCKLHYKTGRDSNILNFDAQEDLFDDPARSMRDYYRHARSVYRCALRQIELSETTSEGGLMRQFLDWRGRLSNSEFTVARDRIFFKMPQMLGIDPLLAIRVFQFSARHGVRLSLDAQRRIAAMLPTFQEYFAAPRLVWPLLRELLAQPSASLGLRGMHDTGVLRAVFPEWEEIECLVVRDFYHRYTVDEHTLTTLANLEELRASKDPARKRFATLLNETEDLPLLGMALLLHDLGKADGLQDHAAVSMRVGKAMLDRIQMPENQQKIVLFLVGHHLDLSAVMNSRDLHDSKTAVEIAARVETLEQLKLLTLLTYADISAVNPDAMTPWRLEQLWQTYLVGHRELTRELDAERIGPAEGDSERGDFLRGFPTRYLHTHTEQEIQAHLDLARKSRHSGAAVALERRDGTYRLGLVTRDHTNLFASLAGVLSAFGLNILKAEAFANESGLVLDTFVFSDPMRTLELNPPEADRLKQTLLRAALGSEDVGKLLRGRPKPVAAPGQKIKPAVMCDNDASTTSTLVEVVAQDRPGLLYDLASIFSSAGCSIDVVLIDTEAHKALDVFYVTQEGGKLAPELQENLTERLLAAV